MARADEYRVAVELGDPLRSDSLGERLRAVDLDEAARERLGRRVVVTRDGSTMFLYTRSESEARQAEELVRELAAGDELSVDVGVTRWHPVEQEWKDLSVPLPSTDAEVAAEYERREEAEAREAAIEGEYDWHVVAALPSRDDAAELARRLEADGVGVARRWRYVVAGAFTAEDAGELADRVRAAAPDGTDVSVEANPADLPGAGLFLLA